MVTVKRLLEYHTVQWELLTQRASVISQADSGNNNTWE